MAAATASLRKASELFAQSCPIYSCNQPRTHRASARKSSLYWFLLYKVTPDRYLAHLALANDG